MHKTYLADFTHLVLVDQLVYLNLKVPVDQLVDLNLNPIESAEVHAYSRTRATIEQVLTPQQDSVIRHSVVPFSMVRHSVVPFLAVA